MNKKQKTSLIVGTIFLILSALFPVWSIEMNRFELRTTRALIYSSGESVLDSPDSSYASRFASVRPDYSRMAVEWAVIILITAVSITLFREDHHGNRQ